MPRREDISKVLIIGSGPIVIGQACEFDYSGTQACKALRKLGYRIVLVNSNPATIMTDPGMADVTYIEPLTVDSLSRIIEKERPDALLPNLGGQTGLNLSSELVRLGVLERFGVRVIGVNIDAIRRGEDRIAFKETMDRLGIEMPRSKPAFNLEEAEEIARELGFPVVIRPAYTMGGTGGGLVYNIDEFRVVASRGLSASLIHQVLVEESVLGWEELELEVVRDCEEPDDHGLLHRECRCDGRAHRRFLLHRADADDQRGAPAAAAAILLRDCRGDRGDRRDQCPVRP